MRSIFLTVSALAIAGGMSGLAAQKPAPPPALALGPVSFPAFTERALSNGAQVVVVENHEQPVVAVNIFIKGAGQTSDTDARPGVASMAATLLDAGTATRTSKQIAEAVESLGANIFTDAGPDWANVGAAMLKADVDNVLQVVADILVNPTYPADEVETERKRELTDLTTRFDRPSYLAQRQFEMALFGKHPYGRQLTKDALNSITREDLVAFHHAYYKPSNALIVVAGDVVPADIVAQLNRHLGVWAGAGPARPQFAAAPQRTRREIILVDKPGAVQASYRIGQTIVPATNPDWPALAVAQQILGGSSTAWLFANLREKKGYTYGAYASSTRQLDPGAWWMYGDVRNAVADSALDLFLEYANRLKTQTVPAADLEIAKARLTGSFPLTIETPSQIAGQVASALLLGQGKQHVQTWRQRVAAVTAADLQRVARKYLQPENSLIVISGDASILKPKLEKYGNLTVVDAEGKPVVQSAAAQQPQQKLTIDASSIQPITMSYVVTAQGMQVAEMSRSITRETANGKDIVKATTSTSGMMTGKQELTFEAKTFTPIASNAQQQAGGREFSSILTVTNGKVSGMVPTPPNGDPQPVDAALPEGAILPGMDEFVIWLTDFSATKELKINVFNPQTSTVIPVTLKVTGESKQKVAAGEFDVYDLEMQGAQGGMKVYVRKAAPHIPVKQEFVAQPIVVELKTLK